MKVKGNKMTTQKKQELKKFNIALARIDSAISRYFIKKIKRTSSEELFLSISIYIIFIYILSFFVFIFYTNILITSLYIALVLLIVLYYFALIYYVDKYKAVK
ncbi:MAG: hypothetical protein QW575_04435 [Thermoproteota archaeon]